MFAESLDAREHCDLGDFDNERDLAAGGIWSCVEREQQTYLEAIQDNSEAMWCTFINNLVCVLTLAMYS